MPEKEFWIPAYSVSNAVIELREAMDRRRPPQPQGSTPARASRLRGIFRTVARWLIRNRTS